MKGNTSFFQSLDWSGRGVDTIRVVPSPKSDRTIVVAIHRTPRFAACSPAELGDGWKNLEPVARITTLTFTEGDLDHVIEDTEKGDEIGEWIRSRS